MSVKSAFIERCIEINQPGWLEMRVALWPDATADEHRGYMAICLAQPERFLQLMIYDEKRQPIGFIEGSIRSDYVNGTESSPVGFESSCLSPSQANSARQTNAERTIDPSRPRHVTLIVASRARPLTGEGDPAGARA